MNKNDFLMLVQNGLEDVFKEDIFENYKSQIFARRLSANFEKTYDESLLWNRALYLSSNACVLILEEGDEKIALHSLKESAEVYEYLGEISERYDRNYAIILAAMCYDLSGYQANAFCLVRQLADYSFKSNDSRLGLDDDNYIIEHILLILKKRIFYA